MVVDFRQCNNCLHYNFWPVLMSETILNFIRYLDLCYKLHSFVTALLDYFGLPFGLWVRCCTLVNCNFHIFSFHLSLLYDMYLYFLYLHLYQVYHIFHRYFASIDFGFAGIDFVDIDCILHNDFDFQLMAYWESCHN